MRAYGACFALHSLAHFISTPHSEVVKTLHKNAATSKMITLSILDQVHEAVAAGKLTQAKGAMQYSIITKPEQWPAKSKQALSFILPQYFS